MMMMVLVGISERVRRFRNELDVLVTPPTDVSVCGDGECDRQFELRAHKMSK